MDLKYLQNKISTLRKVIFCFLAKFNEVSCNSVCIKSKLKKVKNKSEKCHQINIQSLNFYIDAFGSILDSSCFLK